ncbi:hypothetical protein C5Z26_03425 [Lactobacillus sp. CBA3606]|uniref:MFS transporter n=1 Tax=Lactobacillus sp. CBA3606 TaxID=2099789 RepID=UPI000CFAB36D|nr:hypothetical protein C5Z26_03425 [Lactobacillus sp. CBA3606]
MFIFELPSGVLTDRLGPRRTMNFGHVLIIIYLLTMLFAVNYFSLIVGFLAYGIGLSLISGSDQTLIYQINPEQSYQHKIGIFEAIMIIGLTISSLIGGALTTISWDAIFIAGILTQLVAIILLVLLKKQTHEEKLSDDELPMSLKNLAIELLKMLKKKACQILGHDNFSFSKCDFSVA